MFLKYPSLTNHYEIEAGTLFNEMVSVTEKLDGSNISLIIEPTGEYRYASRNQLVSDDWCNVKKLSKEVHEVLVGYATQYGVRLNVYGEVISPKILRRLPYKEQTAWYSIAINEEMLPSDTFYYLFNAMKIIDCAVPHYTLPLEEALKFDVETFKSLYTGDKDEVAEGIVIKPLHSTHFNDKIFAIKKKSKRFSERKPEVTKSLIKEDLTEEEKEFLSLLNESRVLSYYSKYGEMTSLKQMGEYIHGIFTDAVCEFSRGNGIWHTRKVGKIGKGIISKLLRDFYKTTEVLNYIDGRLNDVCNKAE